MANLDKQLEKLVKVTATTMLRISVNSQDALTAFLMFSSSVHDGEIGKAIEEIKYNINVSKEIVPTEITKEGIIDLGFNLSSSLGDKEIYVHQTNMMCIFVNGIFSKCTYLSVKPLNIECMQDLITFINFIHGVGN